MLPNAEGTERSPKAARSTVGAEGTGRVLEIPYMDRAFLGDTAAGFWGGGGRLTLLELGRTLVENALACAFKDRVWGIEARVVGSRGLNFWGLHVFRGLLSGEWVPNTGPSHFSRLLINSRSTVVSISESRGRGASKLRTESVERLEVPISSKEEVLLPMVSVVEKLSAALIRACGECGDGGCGAAWKPLAFAPRGVQDSSVPCDLRSLSRAAAIAFLSLKWGMPSVFFMSDRVRAKRALPSTPFFWKV
mmetsp:Transcript_9970/g.17641  ORF Transcript_9970/g.17641 Transcript_9970/m.17641 type:complete len:249 (-) Transcript_9970:168-914(-)